MEQKHNDKNRFIESYDKYAEAIFRYCLFRVFDREKAKELMQETFTKTWIYLEKGSDIKNMRAFLYKVAHNLCVNEIMRNKPFSLDEMMEKVDFNPVDTNTRAPEDNSEISLLLEKMDLLGKEERELLTMRYIDDLAISEIAELLHMIPNTISVKIRRAEDSLRKQYK